MFLSKDDVQSFIQNGYTIAKGVFSASLAERVVDELWDAMPEGRNDPNTLDRPGFLLQHSMRHSVYPELFTEKLKSAISDLLGEDRWTEAGRLEYHPIEVLPNAGDVVLLHHFTLHAGSANCGSSIRIISNMFVHLKQRACFERPDGNYSPY